MPDKINNTLATLFTVFILLFFLTVAWKIGEIVTHASLPFSAWPERTYDVKVITPAGDVYSHEQLTVNGELRVRRTMVTQEAGHKAARVIKILPEGWMAEVKLISSEIEKDG